MTLFKRFFRKKRRIVIAAVVIVLVLFGGYRLFFYKTPVKYLTAKTAKGELKQTVSVTGSVVAKPTIDLSFQISGKLSAKNKVEGDIVKEGDLLAQLDSVDQQFQTSQAEAVLKTAQANLDLKLAGVSSEDIRVAQSNVASAQAALKQAQTNLDNTIKLTKENIKKTELDLQNTKLALNTAQITLDSGKTNLDNIIQSTAQSVSDEYEDIKTTMAANLIKIYVAMIDIDNILGIDNKSINDKFESALGTLNFTTVGTANQSYLLLKEKYNSANESYNKINSTTVNQEIKSTAKLVGSALNQAEDALIKTRIVLNNTTTIAGFTDADLSTLKTTIDTDRTTINTQQSNLQSDFQAIVSAELDQKTKTDSYQASYDKAKSDYETAQKSVELAEQSLSKTKVDSDNQIKAAQATIQVQIAALNTAQANLSLKLAKPRSVDIAALEAQVAQAQASFDLTKQNLEKTKLTSPVAGVVAKVNGEIGENIAANANFISLITSDLQIEADVSESDINKIKVGQEVTFTLDAFGDEKEFFGKVFFINPAQTVIQDVIYYKIKVSFTDQREDIKPGMTANLDILTNHKENALFISQQAIIEKNGDKIVRILEKEKLREVKVVTGLKGDGGLIEIVDGLKEGQEIVTFIENGK
ncbi:MAG: efflux RND transporter periplasmic adaptor subunit [bacterium]